MIDEVGEDESHPLASLMETLGGLVESYETKNVHDFQGRVNDTLHLAVVPLSLHTRK